jgi:hypothetical protein
MRCLTILTLLVILVGCVEAGTVGMRIKAVRGEKGDTITQWGTCACVAKGVVVAASHTVDRGNLYVEVDEKWVPGTVIATSKGDDICLIAVDAAMEIVEMIELPRMIVSASSESRPVADYVAEFHGGELLYKEAAQGNSGAPVMVGSAMIGIIISMTRYEPPKNEKEFFGAFVGTDKIKKLLAEKGIK